jgi:hypothetical protein
MEGTRSGLPLLAASARPRAGVVLAGCAVLVAVLGAVFARQNMADRFDHAVDAPVITWFAGHHGLALWLAFPGTTKPAVALSLVITAACLLAGRLAGALLAVAAVPVAVGLCELRPVGEPALADQQVAVPGEPGHRRYRRNAVAQPQDPDPQPVRRWRLRVGPVIRPGRGAEIRQRPRMRGGQRGRRPEQPPGPPPVQVVPLPVPHGRGRLG